jgi:anti-sigma B factor antagonist
MVPMILDHRKENDILFVKLMVDELDARIAPSFRQAMTEFISEGSRTIILNLELVKFIDSTGLGSIVSTLKALDEQGDLVLCGAKGPVQTVLELTRMNKVFQIFADEDSAQTALTRATP